MHITLEADYALRIVDTLARHGGRLGAKEIAKRTCVTLRFALKILRKLVAGGIVRSYKGVRGGYEIAKQLGQISVNDVLEIIEGPYALNRCVLSGGACTHRPDKRCPYHFMFEHVSDCVRAQLREITLDQIIAGSGQSSDTG